MKEDNGPTNFAIRSLVRGRGHVHCVHTQNATLAITSCAASSCLSTRINWKKTSLSDIIFSPLSSTTTPDACPGINHREKFSSQLHARRSCCSVVRNVRETIAAWNYPAIMRRKCLPDWPSSTGSQRNSIVRSITDGLCDLIFLNSSQFTRTFFVKRTKLGSSRVQVLLTVAARSMPAAAIPNPSIARPSSRKHG